MNSAIPMPAAHNVEYKAHLLGRHQCALEQRHLHRHNAANFYVRIEHQRDRLEVGEIDAERVAVGQQLLEFLAFALAIARLLGHALDQLHQLVDEHLLLLQIRLDHLELRRGHQRALERLQHGVVHVLRLFVLLPDRVVRLALDAQVPVQVVGQRRVAAGALQKERGQVAGARHRRLADDRLADVRLVDHGRGRIQVGDVAVDCVSAHLHVVLGLAAVRSDRAVHAVRQV